MPIYAYRCMSCGHAKDMLRRMSDPALTDCPQCGAPTFVKQVTAAGFQLKGSGWYVTDFKGENKPAVAPKDDAKPEAPKSDAVKTEPAIPASSSASKGEAAAPVATAPPPAPAPAKPGAPSATGGK